AYPRSVYIIDWCLNIFLLSSIRFSRRAIENAIQPGHAKRRLLVIGAGSSAEMFIRDVEQSPFYPYKIIGLIDDDPDKKGLSIRDVPILGARKDLKKIIETEEPDEFLVAIPSATSGEMEGIVQGLRQTGIPIKILPGLWGFLSGRDALSRIKVVAPEDILFRPPAISDSDELKTFFKGRRVMVTGAGGSIGQELSRHIASLEPSSLVLYERHEENLYKIDMALTRAHGNRGSFLAPVVGDVLDRTRLKETIERYKPEIVFHCAAYKHVPLMEFNPSEAFKTNVIGTKTVAEVSAECKVERFVLISTDKAVCPVNVMGKTKMLAERIVSNLANIPSVGTRFMTVRFGNVLESSGSVVPLFNEQIKRGGPLTVTHPEMTRFFMTIPEAVSLVIEASAMGRGGEVFILDMGEPVKILDLAKRILSLYGYRAGVDIDIVFIGLRPGEKLHEELFNSIEKPLRTRHPKILKAMADETEDGSGIMTELNDRNIEISDNAIRKLLSRIGQ
ncbi:MAG: polysaccharide biosynthesis protein, partial [Deltaproteobacteria bacterium]|nr:polysaccharide biosynthesis protein [Deltaproteobacteria bacterium]